RIVAIPAFSRQYLEFEHVELPPPIASFMAAANPLLSSYVFFRPEFFIPTLIDAMARLVRSHPSAGLVIMGSDAGADSIRDQIRRLGLEQHVVLAGDQPHDAFLTIMTSARMDVRAPPEDGVCSSVLGA